MKTFRNIISFFTLLVLMFADFYAFSTGALIIFRNGNFFGYEWLPLSFFAISLIMLSIFLCSFIWFRNKTKTFGLLLIASLLVLVGILIGNAIYRNHRNSLQINEEVDLSAYEPFKKNNKLAELNENSTLRLSEKLPRLDGATALYPVYAAFARAVYPETAEKYVQCSTTNNAFKSLILGETDIIFTTNPSEEQERYAEEKGVDLHLTPLGKEAFVFFVNNKNKIDNLTVKQIQDIYSGQTTNWEDVGGKNGEIVAYQRRNGSGSQTMFLKLLDGVDIAEPPQERIIDGMGGVMNRAASYENSQNAIGYTFRFYAMDMKGTNKLKLLSIDGISPTIETIKNDTYPYVAEFYAITNGEPTGNSKLLIDWILSPQGQELIEKTGYVGIGQKPDGF